MEKSATRNRMMTLCLTFSLPGVAFGGPVIINGSFEAVQISSPYVSANPADIPGWTHNGTVGDGLLWAVGYADGNGSVTTAGSGNQFVTLGGGYGPFGSADWSAPITGLTPGDSYILSFMTATESGFPGGPEPGGPQTMSVGFLSGSSTPSQSFTSPISTADYWRVWVTQNLVFVATSGTAVVDFSVTNQQYDMGLDNVSVSAAPVPEPFSFFLLGSGMVILTGLIRRHRVRQIMTRLWAPGLKPGPVRHPLVRRPTLRSAKFRCLLNAAPRSTTFFDRCLLQERDLPHHGHIQTSRFPSELSIRGSI